MQYTGFPLTQTALLKADSKERQIRRVVRKREREREDEDEEGGREEWGGEGE